MAKLKGGRKPSPSNCGPLTRSNTLHLNRSGFGRPQIVHRMSAPTSGYNLRVRDIRSRRVFSPMQNLLAVEEGEKSEIVKAQMFCSSIGPATGDPSSFSGEIRVGDLEESVTIAPASEDRSEKEVNQEAQQAESFERSGIVATVCDRVQHEEIQKNEEAQLLLDANFPEKDEGSSCSPGIMVDLAGNVKESETFEAASEESLAEQEHQEAQTRLNLVDPQKDEGSCYSPKTMVEQVDKPNGTGSITSLSEECTEEGDGRLEKSQVSLCLEKYKGSSCSPEMVVEQERVDNIQKPETLAALADAGQVDTDAKNSLNSNDKAILQSASNTKRALANGKMKVFSYSTSFSYRRMLPYVVGILSDALGDSKPKSEIQDDPKRPRLTMENELNQIVETVSPQKVRHEIHQVDSKRFMASEREEYRQMTPPDPEMFKRTEFECMSTIPADNPNSSSCPVHDVLKRSSPSKPESSLKKRILAPCSRRRLFNNQRSVSYRKLLPYLMDISKNIRGDSSVKQITLSEKNLVADTNSSPGAADNDQSSFKQQESCREQRPPNTVVQVPQSSSQSMSVQSNGEALAVALHVPETPIHPDSPGKLEVLLDQKQDFKNAVGSGKRKTCSDMDIGFQMTGPSFENPHNILPLQTSSAPSKGILKRNKLGCRGLCSCLSCSSFRLHAEKNFEFSQNQMFDAEEITLELIKELASLRLLLERSSCPEQRSPVDISQACERAAETENRAKERLRQLKYDLDAHCRIPTLLPPKVTFLACIDASVNN